VERAAGAAVGRTVISVPASFLSRQRTALLAAAAAAGLTDTRLVSDSVAAVIAHTGGERGGTVLAFGIGYGGVEVGLVRALRGRYRALDYAGSASLGGRMLDEQMLTVLVRELGRSGRHGDPADWDEAVWRQLRRSAQGMKEQIAAGQPVLVPGTQSPENGTTLWSVIDPATFESALRGPVARTVDLGHGVLSSTGIAPSDVDTVLLFGGSTCIPLVSTMVAGLSDTVSSASPGHLARGALWYADLIGGGQIAGTEDHLATTADTDAAADRSVPPLATQAFTAPDVPATVWPAPEATATEATGPDPLARAKVLATEGERDAAIALLHDLRDRTTALLAELQAAPQPVQPLAAAAQRPVVDVMARASALLAQGQYEAAVQASHQAWDEEPRRPDVFEAMLDVHVRSADAMSDTVVEELTAARNWLLCAYGHDQGNIRLRGLLAGHEYNYGRELLRLGRKAEALTAIEACFDLNPDHTQARDLLAKLRRTARQRNG
ncbi:MAG TPA: Hsp70 family protein, partial [Pseudonocardiaceae bacterium]|nr:Hsp70 family protein [Pseudonocardiaceae bacterium]